MSLSVIRLIVSFLIAVKAGGCPTDEAVKKQIEGLLVEDKNTFAHGAKKVKYSHVWIRKSLQEICDCSYHELSKKEDGTIDGFSTCIKGSVTVKTGTPETWKATSKKGIFSINGVYDATMGKYTGSTYIIYDDKYAKAFYLCKEDTSWDMVVLVKSDKRGKMGSKEADNEVKQSVEKARLKMVKAATILNLNVGNDVAMYDVDKLC